MITKLFIKNFALIEDITINFKSGLTSISGETGAGKSILLGALELILGKRADLNSVRDNSHKCVIEADFFLEDKKISAVDYCLSDILRNDFDKIVIGVNNYSNLNEIINFKKIKYLNKIFNFKKNDLNLIDPRNWK